MQTTLAPKKRIEYIDALRGFTMLLVVIHHIELFGFHMLPQDFLLNSVFLTFRMPLFFFISGYIAYKADKIWDGKTWWKDVRKKLLVQLLPTLIFGLLFTYLILEQDFCAFVTSDNKLGYWFTLALLNMFVIYYTFNFLAHKFSRNGGGGILLLFITALILYPVALLLQRQNMPSGIKSVIDILCLTNTFVYFQFFIFGNLCARYFGLFERFLKNRWAIALIILGFCALFGLYRYCFSSGETYGLALQSIKAGSNLLSRYCGLLIVFAFFKRYQDSFTATTRLGSVLQYIGKRTLDIYLLHYFLLPSLPWIGDFFKTTPNIVLEFTIGIVLALLVTGMSLLIGNILRTSDLLGHYLFGAKLPQKQ